MRVATVTPPHGWNGNVHPPRAFNSCAQPRMRSCTSSGATSVRCQASVHFGFAGTGFAVVAGLACFLVAVESLPRKTREKNGIPKIHATAWNQLEGRCARARVSVSSVNFFGDLRQQINISGGIFKENCRRPTGNLTIGRSEEKKIRDKPGRDVLQPRDRLQAKKNKKNKIFKKKKGNDLLRTESVLSLLESRLGQKGSTSESRSKGENSEGKTYQ